MVECESCIYRQPGFYKPEEDGWCYMFKERFPNCQAGKRDTRLTAVDKEALRRAEEKRRRRAAKRRM